MTHVVHYYDSQVFTTDAFGREYLAPTRSVAFEDAAEAVAATEARLAETGSISAVSLAPDWRRCAGLAEYLRLLNTEARWLEANFVAGAFKPAIVEDPEHWAGDGIHSLEDFVRDQAFTAYSEAYKATFGTRPRGHIDADTPLAEIEAALAAL